MVGGYWNQVWRVDSDAGRIVIKQYADPAGTPMYPNLADHEAASLTHLAPHGLSPTLLAYLPGTPPIVVYRFVEGSVGYRTPGEAGELLRRLQAAPIAGLAVRSLMRSAAEAVAHGDQLIAMTDGGPDLHRLRPAQPSSDSVEPVICHTDSGPGNVVATETTSIFIDWQAPGLGDPVEDLVCMTSPAMMILYDRPAHSEAEEAELLTGYGNARVIERYRRDRAAWTYRIAAFCRYRTASADEGQIRDAYARALAAEIELLERLS